jgi:glycosyltransferase involved in cell wall biosynthesis
MQPKLLIVSNYSGGYGSERSLEDIVTALEIDLSIRVVLNESANVPDSYLKSSYLIKTNFNVLSKSSKWPKLSSLIFWFNLLRSEKPDFIIVNISLIPEIIFIARILNIKCFVFIRESLIDQKLLFTFYKPFLIKLSTKLVCNSKYTASMFDQNSTEVVYNTMPVNKVDKVDKVDKIYDYIYVGRISPRKGVNLLFDCLSLLDLNVSNMNVAIVGDYKDEDKCFFDSIYKQSKVFKNITVYFLGYKDKPAEYINKSRFLVAPSILPETFGRTLLEAYSLSVPVISTPAGAYFELNNQFGLVSQYCDNDSLFKVLLSSLSIKGDDYHILCESVYNYSKTFSQDNYKIKLLGLLQNA